MTSQAIGRFPTTHLGGFFVQRRRRSVRHEKLVEVMLGCRDTESAPRLFSHATANMLEAGSFNEHSSHK